MIEAGGPLRGFQVIDQPSTRDVRGGWYDASGDISKYLSHLSYANLMNPQQTPLVAWALAWAHDTAAPLLASEGLRAEVEAEAIWGADFLVRMTAGPVPSRTGRSARSRASRAN